jgi:CCR4-NOT transcription complex subunit 7/8
VHAHDDELGAAAIGALGRAALPHSQRSRAVHIIASPRALSRSPDKPSHPFSRPRALAFPTYSQDTEFPGVVVRPVGQFSGHSDFHYQTLRVNVDLLRIIQLGLTFSDENGELAEGCPTFQFNFRFSLGEDIFAQDSIELLQRAGIDFAEHQERGIEVEAFGEQLMSSGLVLSDDVRWLSFHSGYDFGYLLKLLTCLPLPPDEAAFSQLLKTYFPMQFDVKQLMTVSDRFHGGLQRLADDLAIERVGVMHQAGSDSLLTSAAFFKLRKLFFNNRIDEAKWGSVLYGLAGGAGVSGAR